MKKKILALSLALGCVGNVPLAHAEIIYESALLGQTGRTPTTAPNIALDSRIAGSRFSLSHTYDITAIGGHLGTFGTIWGAIIPMEDSLPTFGRDAIEAEALASAIFVGAFPSRDVRAPVQVRLDPGSYALIFGGGGLFGTTGMGFMPANNTDISAPESLSYFHHTSSSTFDWRLMGFSRARFVVEGTLVATQQPPVSVPEPPIHALVGLALAGLAWGRRMKL